jgi:hypothetical protein
LQIEDRDDRGSRLEAGESPRQSWRSCLFRLRSASVPVVFLVVGLWMCLEALQLPFGSVRMPGPGFFPLLLGLTFSLLALVLLGAELLADPKVPIGNVAPAPAVLSLIGAIFAAAWLFERAGFLLTMFLFLMVVLKALGQVRWPTAVAVALLGSVCAYLLFDRLLMITLPSGSLPF